MIAFRYLTQFHPPAPFISVTIGRPLEPHAIEHLPARVDSAAGRTVIPQSVACALRLEPTNELQFEGVGGHVESMPIYPVILTVRGLGPHQVDAAAHPGETAVLLGRDVFNRYRVLLDGPNPKLEVT